MQLVAYGAQDVYLTGNPQITFFKVVYRRHTNFSMEAIEFPLNGNPEFGRKSIVTITRNGDLITKVYLMVTVNSIDPAEGAMFGWVRRLGHAMLEEVEVEIGGSRIDRQFGIWLDIWYELARHAGDGERGYLRMIGDVPELTAYSNESTPQYKMFIPLQFWFNRHVGLALPLIALQYHEVRLHFEFARAAELVVANSCFKSCNARDVSIQDAQVLVDYIYLDSEERRRFAQVGHEYLIEQIQFTGVEGVLNQSQKYELHFNHPTKELVWAMRNGKYTTGCAFPAYTNADSWDECGSCGILHEAACKILKESLCLLDSECDAYGNLVSGEEPPFGGNWECFPAGEAGYTANGNIHIENNGTKTLWVNTDSLVVKDPCPNVYSLTDKISASVVVDENDIVTCSDVSSDLTVRDLSICTDLLCDTRCEPDDACVYQWNNYGVLIDGSVNPVVEGLLQLNGHDRFDRREGDYFNYVQPDQHHTNTPADGINVYSFAIHPEQHQPSGTANLSRIDNTMLNLVFRDSTARSGLPDLGFLNSDNKLYINKNVYQSKFFKLNLLVEIVNSILATSSNCGKLFKQLLLNQYGNMLVAQIKLRSYIIVDMETSTQPISSNENIFHLRKAAQRLNVDGPNGLRYSLVHSRKLVVLLDLLTHTMFSGSCPEWAVSLTVINQINLYEIFLLLSKYYIVFTKHNINQFISFFRLRYSRI